MSDGDTIVTSGCSWPRGRFVALLLFAFVVPSTITLVQETFDLRRIMTLSTEQTAINTSCTELTAINTSSTEQTAINTSCTEQTAINTSCRKTTSSGIDPVYVGLLEEAEQRTSLDFEATRPPVGSKGLVIGPVAGDFVHTLSALQNARRIRTIQAMNITSSDQDMKLALIADKEHIELLHESCGNTSVQQQLLKAHGKEACRLWANGSLFDDIIFNGEPPVVNESHAAPKDGQPTGRYWMTALSGYLLAPYEKSIFLDTDAYPCPGISKMFALTHPYSERLWELPSTKTVDFAAGLDQWKYGSEFSFPAPGDPAVLTDWKFFSVRNTGTTLFHLHRPTARAFMHFIPLVAEHVYNNVANEKLKVVHDQTPFRIALYVFQKLVPDFTEASIPMHTSCRTYPFLLQGGGIDGTENGMLPKTANGSVCSECHCSPCLISHFHRVSPYNLKMNGKMGWEEDISLW